MIINEVIDAFIEALKSKFILSDIETDLLKSYNELSKRPEDRNSLINKILTNRGKYKDKGILSEETELAAIQTQWNMELKPLNELSLESLKVHLRNQIIYLYKLYTSSKLFRN